MPNIDFPAICSPRFKPGPPGEEAQVLSDRLNDTLISYAHLQRGKDAVLTFQSSEVLPTTSLCIHPGKSVWVLYIDATCLNYDGNAFDAALLAMIAALKNSKRTCIYTSVYLPNLSDQRSSRKQHSTRRPVEQLAHAQVLCPSISDVGRCLHLLEYSTRTSFNRVNLYCDEPVLVHISWRILRLLRNCCWILSSQ